MVPFDFLKYGVRIQKWMSVRRLWSWLLGVWRWVRRAWTTILTVVTLVAAIYLGISESLAAAECYFARGEAVWIRISPFPGLALEWVCGG